MLRKIHVSVKGTSPLLMNAFPLKPVDGASKMEPKAQAELCVYRDKRTQELFVPAMNVQRALVSAASFSKGKGRASLQREVAACVLVSPEQIGLGTKEFELDERAVVVPATRGRIVRYRARFNSWRLDFAIEYDPRLLKADQLRRIVEDMGSRVGLLDFRPERKGPFGRSVVTKWKEEAAKGEAA